MKLTQYDSTINRNLSNAKINPITDPNAYGANVTGTEALGNALGQVIDARTKAWMKDQNDRVVDATNEYNRQINSLLYDEKNGLTNTMQGKNAEGLQAAYQQNEEQIRQQIMRQYGISSEYANRAFHNQVETSITSNLDSIDKFQRKEFLSYASNQMTEMNENAINSIVRSPDSFESVYGNMETTSRAIMAGTGMDEKSIDIKQRAILDHTAETVLSTLAASNDYERGNTLIGQLRARGGNEVILKKYETLFTGKKVAKTTKDSAETWLNNHPEMMGKSKEEVWEAYRKENPLQLPAQSNETALGRIGDTIAKELGWDPSWGFAIAAHESGRGESAPGNNYFGYKWDGEGEYQELNTWERDENGNAYSTTAKFKKYATPEESAMSYVNWIKTYCTPEEIKGVKSPADVVHIMKKHGYFTDHEESYAASATELAKEYSAPAPMSDEEKAALEETERNSFFSVLGEHFQAKKAKETEMMNNLQIQLMDMTENGTSNEDMYEFIKSKGVENPELLNNGSYRSLRLSALKAVKGEDAYGGFGTKENQNKAFEKYMNRIGVDILDKKTLDEDLKNAAEILGKAFRPEQIIELEQELTRAQAGEGKYAIKIDEDKNDVMDMTGLAKPEIEKYFSEAKKIVMQKAFEFKNKNGREPNQFERKNMWIEAYTQKKVGPDYGFFGMSTPEASDAQLMQMGIKEYHMTYDDKGIDAVDYYGRHHYIPAEDWDKVKKNEVNIEDY
jgi:flagellum-specific peptidoglycan hydrolase FlgJ|nr:MAG TPA: Muramidase (flagellum-specific) [Caudoviricetes sp.]